jgi:hypothetical protein
VLRCAALVRTEVSEEINTSIIRVKRIDELGKTISTLVRINVSEELGASIIRVTRIGELETSSPILVDLMMKALSSSETSVLTRVTRPNIFIVTAVINSDLAQ